MVLNQNAEVMRKLQTSTKNYSETPTDFPFVIVTNESGQPVEVQPAYPKPNRKQILRKYNYYNSGDNTVQIATSSTSTKIFFLGIQRSEGGASAVVLTDASSGTINVGNGNTDNIWYTSTASAVHAFDALPLPVECTKGIRLRVSSGASSTSVIVYYIEESVE